MALYEICKKHQFELQSVELTAESVASFDAVLLATEHDAVDYALGVDKAALVVDTRNVCARLGLVADTIYKA